MKNFSELNISPNVSRAIEELGYQTPTPIQAQALPLLLQEPTDFLGLAATGTGKTAAFAIPLIQGINASLRKAQALVLCPTRELAVQVAQQVQILGKYSKVSSVCIYGGAGYADQIRGLRQGAQVIVATPGRLIDHLKRGSVDLSGIQTVVLDEADEMVSMGFKDAIESILERMEEQGFNTWLFSATMSPEVRRVADRFLHQPKIVQPNKAEMLSGTVREIYFKVRESDKFDVLCKFIDMTDDFYGLIFCQTKSLVIDLTQFLQRQGYMAECLHGDKDQRQRDRAMAAFREKRVNILVCTDVASRGIDVKELTHVVNYSLPRELDSYVHRIGRTGRSGKAGIAVSLVTPSHMDLISKIERKTRSRMELAEIPTRKDVAGRKIAAYLEKFSSAAAHERATAVLGQGWKTALESMSKEEIAGRFLAMKFDSLFVDKPKTERSAPAVGAPAGGAPRGERGRFRDSERSPRPFGGRRDGDRFGSAPRSRPPMDRRAAFSGDDQGDAAPFERGRRERRPFRGAEDRASGPQGWNRGGKGRNGKSSRPFPVDRH